MDMSVTRIQYNITTATFVNFICFLTELLVHGGSASSVTMCSPTQCPESHMGSSGSDGLGAYCEVDIYRAKALVCGMLSSVSSSLPLLGESHRGSTPS